MPKNNKFDENFINIGDEELAKLMPGGSSSIEIGSIILIHRTVNSDMTGVASSLMKNILIRNALGNELGVIDITSGSYVTSKILRMTTEPQYTSRYVEVNTTKVGSKNIMLLKGKSIMADFSKENINSVLPGSNAPNMYLFSTDLLNFIYGDGFIGEFLQVINELRNSGIIIMIVEDQIYRKLGHYANSTIHILDMDGLVYTNTGKRTHYGIEVVNSKDAWPSIKLIESV